MQIYLVEFTIFKGKLDSHLWRVTQKENFYYKCHWAGKENTIQIFVTDEENHEKEVIRKMYKLAL